MVQLQRAAVCGPRHQAADWRHVRNRPFDGEGYNFAEVSVIGSSPRR